MLDLIALTRDVSTMGEDLSGLKQNDHSILQVAQERLAVYANDLDALQAKVHLTRERSLHWRGSYSDGDPLNARFPVPDIPPKVTIVANDGSQAPIDRHAAALYYAINIGYIVYHYGNHRSPQVATQPELHWQRDKLFDRFGQLIPTVVVNARRTLREIQNLANLAKAYTKDEPAVAVLSDGPLLWVMPGETPKEREKNLAPYLQSLTRLQDSGATLGGYVDRPRSSGIVNLLYLATLDDDEISRDKLGQNDMPGLTDAGLFATLLEPGERSGLFVRQSPTNRLFMEKGHEIGYCYLNVSDNAKRALVVRLEVPLWIGRDKAQLDLLHAVIWQQCRIVGDYPYVLARAHELALISTDERSDLEEMVISELRRRGLNPRPSAKAWHKQLTGGSKRRHRL